MNENLGPCSYENWKAALSDEGSHDGYEVPLFTDAHVTGEILEGFGPYQLLNPIAISRSAGSVTPGVILRVENYLEISSPSSVEMDRTNDTRYHGGLLHDEIAALSSLILGVKFKSGGITREFCPDCDPRGMPVHFLMDRDPILLCSEGKLIIPKARNQICLNDLDQLLTYPNLTPEDAIILVRASRIYQDALWIAESEPELAWIMFVSAIETAANHWRKAQATPVENVEKLHTSLPGLESLLNEQGVPDLAEKVAEFLAQYTGATRKFVGFVLEFLPPEPRNRPRTGKHPWEKEKMRKTLGQVYDYRSKALHGSGKFPAPMCMPPFNDGSGYDEVPLGLATSAQGGVWVKKDSPILLHTFEYIVRGVLLNWWASLIPEASVKSDVGELREISSDNVRKNDLQIS